MLRLETNFKNELVDQLAGGKLMKLVFTTPSLAKKNKYAKKKCTRNAESDESNRDAPMRGNAAQIHT